MSTKQLINVGVYTALYFVIMFAMAMIGAISPLFMFVGYGLGIVINGPVIMLFLAKVRNAYGWLILGIILSVLMAMMGHPWYSVIITPALSLAAGFIAKSGDFRSTIKNSVAYGVFSMWYMVPWIPFFINQEAYLKEYMGSMGPEYIKAFQEVITVNVLYGWGVVCFIIGVIGGFIGMKLMAKHFVKAGLAQ